MGLGRMFLQQRVLSWLVHTCMELCPGISTSLPGTRKDTQRTGTATIHGRKRGMSLFVLLYRMEPTRHSFHAASDGQLGGIMKVYRDWQICGDDLWLRKMYPLAKKSIDYCIKNVGSTA